MFDSLTNPISTFLQKICEPYPHVIPNHIERGFIFRRNKSAFAITLLIFIMTILNLIFGQIQLDEGIFILTLLCIGIGFFLATCCSHPRILKLVYFLILGIYGPFSLYNDKTGSLISLNTVFTVPSITLFLCGIKAFIPQALLQISYALYLLERPLLNSLEHSTHQEHIQKLIDTIFLGTIVNAFLTLMNYFALSEARQQINIEIHKQQHLEKQKTFLLSFSHDLRNLINTVNGSVQLSLLEPLSPKVKELLSNCKVCGELLLHLLNNILDTGKVEIGELEINPSRNAVHETLEKVWAICSQLIKNKRLKGQMCVSKNLPHFLVIDNYRLMQILINLISNSVKFTEIGGRVNIAVEWISNPSTITDKSFLPEPFDDENEGIFEKRQAMVSLMKDQSVLTTDHSNIEDKSSIELSHTSPSVNGEENGILKLIVTDTGSGIEKQKLPHLFKKFTQVSSDPSKRKLGTGLGLFITKHLVERMGGEIRAFSKFGKGTAFIACIPIKSLQRSGTQITRLDSFMNLITAERLTAMIVDDVDFNLIMISKLLSKLNVEVKETAINGLDAFGKFKAHVSKGKHFDIITMDVDMPLMDGRTSMRLIREYEIANNLKPCLLIIVSGNCSESEIAACVDSSHGGKKVKADYFLKKPVALEEFKNVIRAHFETQ